MAGLTISLEGDEELLSRLGALGGIDASPVVRATVGEIAQSLRNGGMPVGTGEMRSSVYQRLEGTNTGYVGVAKEYAPHVEYGHRQQVGRYVPAIGKRLKAPYVEGQHFFQRAVRAGQDKFRDRMDRYITRVMGG